MSAETALLDALAAFLATRTGLAARRVGTALPAVAADLPAIALSLPEVRRTSPGLGERAAVITDGALPVRARIDLARPFLPGEPGFSLVSADRLRLVLPHGGQVKADATTGTLAAADLQVRVAGALRSVVNAAPGAAEVQPDPTTGTLRFGAPLPAIGELLADYFLGQWERRVTPLAGRLQVSVWASSAPQVQTLTVAVADALEDAAALPHGLRKVALASLGATGVLAPNEAGPANARQRQLVYGFEYDHEINRPDSSGGVIRQIPIRSRLLSTAVDPASGAITTALEDDLPTEVPP
jgi:hypothetical protein